MVRYFAMLRLAAAALLFGLLILAQQKNTSMTNHARGIFTVDVHPLTPAPAEGLSRFSIDKQIHGDLEATSKGEMFSGGDPKQGVAGYVAIEVVTGMIRSARRDLSILTEGTRRAGFRGCQSLNGLKARIGSDSIRKATW